jgi:hypothetical protein
VISSEAAESLQAAQETAEREDKLLVALSEAQSSLVNLQKLHEASQKQLFNMQSRTEEEQVHPHCPPWPPHAVLRPYFPIALRPWCTSQPPSVWNETLRSQRIAVPEKCACIVAGWHAV